MVQLKKFESTSSSLKSEGTIKSICGKGGEFTVLKRNVLNPATRRVIKVMDKDGNSDLITCSKAVSNQINERQLTLAQIANLSVIENEEGVSYVSNTASALTCKIDDIKATKATVLSTTFLPEELVAF